MALFLTTFPSVHGQTLADITSYCSSSSTKYAGCFLASTCQGRSSPAPNPDYCDASKLLSHMCSVDGATGDMCDDAPSDNQLPSLPTAEQMHQYNNEICGTHFMNGCAMCDPHYGNGASLSDGCDAMDAYTNMCKGKLNMSRERYGHGSSSFLYLCRDAHDATLRGLENTL